MEETIGYPKTMEELRAYCTRNGIALKKIKVVIGENDPHPRRFGMYQEEESGDFVVYKNMKDGTRRERYRGKSEEEAVDILLKKISCLSGDAVLAEGNAAPIGTGLPVSWQKKLLVISTIIIGFNGIRAFVSNSLPEGYYKNRKTDALVYRCPDGDLYEQKEDGWKKYHGLSVFLERSGYEYPGTDLQNDFRLSEDYAREVREYERELEEEERKDYGEPGVDWNSAW